MNARPEIYLPTGIPPKLEMYHPLAFTRDKKKENRLNGRCVDIDINFQTLIQATHLYIGF